MILLCPFRFHPILWMSLWLLFETKICSQNDLLQLMAAKIVADAIAPFEHTNRSVILLASFIYAWYFLCNIHYRIIYWQKFEMNNRKIWNSPLKLLLLNQALAIFQNFDFSRTQSQSIFPNKLSKKTMLSFINSHFVGAMYNSCASIIDRTISRSLISIQTYYILYWKQLFLYLNALICYDKILWLNKFSKIRKF